MASKTEIRATIKERFATLDENNKKIMDKKIIKNILNLEEYAKAKTIFSYVSKDKEVDTLELIVHSINNKKIVGVPIVKEKYKLDSIRINSLNELKIGKYNILEPKENSEKINPKDFELLFIPGLAFGIGGERLGRGGGYFDRFLLELPGLKIGLAYEFQIFNSLPILDHDIKMDLIVTDKRILTRV